MTRASGILNDTGVQWCRVVGVGNGMSVSLVDGDGTDLKGGGSPLALRPKLYGAILGRAARLPGCLVQIGSAITTSEAG